MKKLIFILAVILFSCQKENCYRCTTVYTTTTTGGSYASNSQTTSSSIVNCDMTQKEADRYEQEMNKTATVTSGTTVITTVGRCNCKIE